MRVTRQNPLGVTKGARAAMADAFQGNAWTDEPAQLCVQRREQGSGSAHRHCAGCWQWCPWGCQALPASLRLPRGHEQALRAVPSILVHGCADNVVKTLGAQCSRAPCMVSQGTPTSLRDTKRF